MTARRIKRVIAERGHALQVARFCRRQAEAAIKQGFAYRQRNRQRIRRDSRPENTGVDRREPLIALLIGAATSEKGNAFGQGAQQALKASTVRRQHIKGDQHTHCRTRRSDALLMRSVEGMGLLGNSAGRRVCHLCLPALLAGNCWPAQACGGGPQTGNAQPLQKTPAIQTGKRATKRQIIVFTHRCKPV